ncbi:MAG: nucleotidyltransferase [Pedobacter sp.]|nr:nucleotidyltransferase [Pedobacter sp.]
MGNIFNEDFRDFIQALNNCKVRYVLVGGFSVILHGYSRTTGDIDIWVDRSSDNYQKIKLAFLEFGMPVFDMTEENFLKHKNWDVFTFGNPPSAIDLMLAVKGLSFDDTFNNATTFEDDGLLIKTIHKDDLISAKKAAGRPKDLDDLENLQSN